MASAVRGWSPIYAHTQGKREEEGKRKRKREHDGGKIGSISAHKIKRKEEKDEEKSDEKQEVGGID